MFNSAGPINQPQIFWNLRIQDFFLQELCLANGEDSFLILIEDINLVNRSNTNERFEKIFRKKPKPTNMTEDESDEFLSKMNSEIEEELDPLENDGLPQIQYYSNIINNNDLPLVLFEHTKNPIDREDPNDIKNIDVRLSVNHFEFYFDRIMINGVMNNILNLQ